MMHTQQSRRISCFSAPQARSVTGLRRQRQSSSQFRAQTVLRSSRSSYVGQALHVQGSSQRQQRRPTAGTSSQVVLAAIFGVGAPEALLVGVVALVVFGPKGLAQAVKSLGATLKTFSPTIRELASVTNELSSTLQEQIGLDDIRNEFRNPSPTYSRTSEADKASTSKSTTGSSGEDAKEGIASEVAEVPSRVLEAQIEESKRLAWGDQGPPKTPSTSATAQTDLPPSTTEKATNPAEKAAEKPAEKPARKPASDLSIDELEAELARRRKATAESK